MPARQRSLQTHKGNDHEETEMLDYRGIILNRLNELKWTQVDLAEYSGVSKATICQMLGGKTMPHFATLEDLMNAIGYEIIVQKKEENHG